MGHDARRIGQFVFHNGPDRPHVPTNRLHHFLPVLQIRGIVLGLHTGDHQRQRHDHQHHLP